ncbi:MAG: molybdenum cofactor guanylyltransferase [Candidatus Poribacteria bacterium]|nr:molybdenum cofactor guanylyltransferase [Candidatus Poribacteria bacterium]
MGGTGVILAGGDSRRMGQNKALMRLGDETLISRTLKRLQIVTDETIVISNSVDLYNELGVRVYEDLVPKSGALGGVYTGLTHAVNSAVVCIACDMPLLQPKLMNYLLSVLGDHDAVVPYTREMEEESNPKLQTLCAVYSRRCGQVIRQMLEEGELRLHALCDRIKVRRVPPGEWREFDPDGLSFVNVNTREDFERVRKMLEHEMMGDVDDVNCRRSA